MTTMPPLILIVGAADTGRAPMTAALLLRLLEREGFSWRVESAGVVGHDGDPAEPEARYAMAARNLDIGAHRARSLDAALAEEAIVLLAIERGIARVLYERYPQARIAVLGELAGTRRDIPDPFRMQTGAWLSYAQEIEGLLKAALPALSTLVAGDEPQPPLDTAIISTPTTGLAEPIPALNNSRSATLARSLRVLTVLADFPGVLDWPAARHQIETDLAGLVNAPLSTDDLVQPYVALINALLALTIQPPSVVQREQLQLAFERLQQPVDQAALTELSALVPRWATL
jgi:protein-tyrosine-phosphatase